VAAEWCGAVLNNETVEAVLVRAQIMLPAGDEIIGHATSMAEYNAFSEEQRHRLT
jgi:hypothetical protein